MRELKLASSWTLLATMVVAFAPEALAVPAVTEASGAMDDGAVVTVRGSGFGTKTQPAPIVFDQVDTVWDNGVPTHPYAGLADNTIVPTGHPTYPWANNAYSSMKLDQSFAYGRHTLSYRGDLTDATAQAWVDRNRAWPAPATSGITQYYARWYFRPSWQPASGSHKFHRIWDTNTSTIVGLRSSWTVMHLTHSQASGSDRVSWTNWGGQANVWNLLEVFVDTKNNIIRAWTNGKLVHNLEGITITAAAPQGIYPRLIGWDPAGGVPEGLGQQIWMAEYYADRTMSRVELCDSPDWASCKVREVQMPVSWSDTEVKFQTNLGALPSGKPIYVYVIDQDGTVNQQGTALLSPTKVPNPPDVIVK